MRGQVVLGRHELMLHLPTNALRMNDAMYGVKCLHQSQPCLRRAGLFPMRFDVKAPGLVNSKTERDTPARAEQAQDGSAQCTPRLPLSRTSRGAQCVPYDLYQRGG
ncbi:Uncharacterised protein [Chlamydia trachomatis]|nr:Uncharacterised protein [Chlamydia trachomatis]